MTPSEFLYAHMDRVKHHGHLQGYITRGFLDALAAEAADVPFMSSHAYAVFDSTLTIIDRPDWAMITTEHH